MATDSLQSMMGIAQANTTGAALSKGMELASQAQGLEKQKADLDNMREQLDTQKFNKAMSSMSTLAKTRPEIAKRMVPRITDQLRQAGVPVDQGVLDLMASDESYKTRFQLVGSALSGMATDPAARSQAMQAFADIGEFDKGLSTFESQNKYKTQAELATVRADAMTDAARIKADSQGAAAANRSANTTMRTELQANQQYSREMKQTEEGLSQANRAVHLLEGIKSGDLQANKALRADLTSVLASLVGGGRPSTVYGQQHNEFDSAYQNVADKLNYIKGDAKNTLPPEQLKQLDIDVKALQHLYAEQHANKFTSFREGIPEQLQAKLDGRFNKFREKLGLEGLGTTVSESGQSAGASATKTAPPAKLDMTKYDAPTQAKIKQARDAGYADADILKKLGK